MPPYRDICFKELANHYLVDVCQTDAIIPAERNWTQPTETNYRLFHKTWFGKNDLSKYDSILSLDNGISTFIFNINLLVRKPKKTKFYLWVGRSQNSIRFAYKNRPFRAFLSSLLTRILYSFTNGFLAYSTQSHDFIKEKVPQSRIISVGGQQYPIKVDDIKYRRNLIGSINFLYIGADAERKGLYDIIITLNRIAKQCKRKIKLNVAGPTTKIAAFDRDKNFEIVEHGFVKNRKKNQLFQESDIFILLSKDEPWGHVYTEALTHMKIPVATTGTGAQDMIKVVFPGSWQHLIIDLYRAKLDHELINIIERYENLIIELEKSDKEGKISMYSDPQYFVTDIKRLLSL